MSEPIRSRREKSVKLRNPWHEIALRHPSIGRRRSPVSDVDLVVPDVRALSQESLDFRAG